MKLEVTIAIEPIGGEVDLMTIESLHIDGLTHRQSRLMLDSLPEDVEHALLVLAAGPPKERRQGERRGIERRLDPQGRRKKRAISGTHGFFTDRNGKSVTDKRVSGQRRYIQDGYNGRRKYLHDRRKK